MAGWMAFVALFGLVLLGWAIYNGQLDELEETRFIPFEEREPLDWPAPRRPTKGV